MKMILISFIMCNADTMNPRKEVQYQGPHSDILMTGGLTVVHILYPKKPNFRICLPKKIPTFLAYPKKSHTSRKLHLRDNLS